MRIRPLMIGLGLVLAGGCTKSNYYSSSKEPSQAKESQGSEASANVEKENGEAAGEEKAQEEERELALIEKAVHDEEVVHVAGLKEGEEQMAILCERNKGVNNLVVQRFCVEGVRPTSIAEMQQALGLAVPPNTGRGGNGANGSPGYAVQGHSSSLVGQFVSAINPRVVIFNDQRNADPNLQNPVDSVQTDRFIAMGFVRGEQFAEILVANLDANGAPMQVADNNGNMINDVAIYLVAFKQACNAKPEGCMPGELLTPAVESNWTEFTVYQDVDLKNTIVDCQHCHQPEGPGTQKFGRMQELANPWVHWMRDNRVNGQVLYDDYLAAHGPDETYGGIPGSSIQGSDPANLEDMVRQNGFNQDQIPEIEFQTQTILNEITANNGAQPADNTTPGESDTWEQLFQISMTGVSSDGRNIIPIPYHDVKVTEPALLNKFTQQYQQFRAGNLPMEQFEDHRAIFRTDHKELADMGFAVREGTPPETILIQACFQCHNKKLDQTITRSRFDIDVDHMVAREDVDAVAEIDLAIKRLKLGYTPERLAQEGIKFYNEETLEEETMDKGAHILTMPPRRFKSLTDQQIDSVIQHLRSEQDRIKAAAGAASAASR